MFGVGGTSETGSYDPVPTTTNILSVTNNGDGTYTFVTDQPNTSATLDVEDTFVVVYSPSNNIWVPTRLTTVNDPVTFTITADAPLIIGAITDGTWLGVLAPMATLTFTEPPPAPGIWAIP